MRTQSIPPSTAPTFADISDPFYIPPLWVRLNTAAAVLSAAAAYEEGYDRAMRSVELRAMERAVTIGDIRSRLETLKTFTATLAVDNEQTKMQLTSKGEVREESEPTSPIQKFGSQALLSSSEPPPPSLPNVGNRATELGFSEENTFPTFSDGTSGSTSPASQPMLQTSPPPPHYLGPPSVLTPNNSAQGPKTLMNNDAIMSPSPNSATVPPNGPSSYPTMRLPTSLDLVAIAAEVGALTRQSIDRTTNALAYGDKVLGILGAEYRNRGAIMAEEGYWSGFGVPAGYAPTGLLAHHLWLLQKCRFNEEVTLQVLNESQGRSAIEREVGTFYSWAMQSEPQWRAGVQRVVDERLAKEAAEREEQRKVQEAQRLRQMALEAIASETANAEAKRVSELARLREEELALARRLQEKREAELAAAAAMQAQLEREERQRKDEEYSRLLQAEEELQHKMQQERERVAAAEAERQRQQDEAYAKLLQDQIVLEERLRAEEEQLKARMEAAERAKEAAERAKQAEQQRKHAELVAAEEAARAAYEAKQRALAIEKEKIEEARLAKEREREQMLAAMVEAAKAEEDRLRLSQLHRVMTSSHNSLAKPQATDMPYPPPNQTPYMHSQPLPGPTPGYSPASGGGGYYQGPPQHPYVSQHAPNQPPYQMYQPPHQSYIPPAPPQVAQPPYQQANPPYHQPSLQPGYYAPQQPHHQQFYQQPPPPGQYWDPNQMRMT